MRKSYPNSPAIAKLDPTELRVNLEELCRRQLSVLLQAVLEAEVDEALERLRYERRSESTKGGYRDGFERPRTVTSNRGPIDVRRPRVRGAAFASAVLPRHKRRGSVQRLGGWGRKRYDRSGCCRLGDRGMGGFSGWSKHS